MPRLFPFCLLPLAALLGAAAEPPSPAAKSAYIGPHSLIEVEPGRRINLLCMGSGDRTVLFDVGSPGTELEFAL